MRPFRGFVPDGCDDAAAVARYPPPSSRTKRSQKPAGAPASSGSQGGGPSVLLLERRRFPHRQRIVFERRIDVVSTGLDTIEHAAMHRLAESHADLPVVDPSNSHQSFVGFMQCAIAVWPRPVEFLIDRHRIEIEQSVDQASHPQESNIAGSMVGITTPDVGVNAGKPGLMDGLAG